MINIEEKIKELESNEPIKPKHLYLKMFGCTIIQYIMLSPITLIITGLLFGILDFHMLLKVFLILSIVMFIPVFVLTYVRINSQTYYWIFNIFGIKNYIKEYNDWYFKLKDLNEFKNIKEKLDKFYTEN